MNVLLTTELETFVQSKVSSGVFQNATEVILSALSTMRDADKEMAQLHRQVSQGWAQAEAGDLLSENTVKEAMTSYKAQWLSNQKG